jgi:hypothetical protein
LTNLPGPARLEESRRKNMPREITRAAVERGPLEETGPKVVKNLPYYTAEDVLQFVKENYKDPMFRYIMLAQLFPR